MSPEPTKAYEVERVGRTVTTFLVYADSPAHAKERYLAGDFEYSLGSETEGRGFAGIRRVESEDRK